MKQKLRYEKQINVSKSYTIVVNIGIWYTGACYLTTNAIVYYN